MKMDNYQEIKSVVDDFLRKENSSETNMTYLQKKYDWQLESPNLKLENL